MRLAGGPASARGCRIGAGVILTDAVVGEGVTRRPYTVVEESTRRRRDPRPVLAAPPRQRTSARRPTSATSSRRRRTQLGKGAKANHLAYLGDADIGAGVNVGAGTITCNYDGEKKHQTTIGAGAFIGSDSILVAPIEIGAGAYVAAGSTVTEDVPPGALALAARSK